VNSSQSALQDQTLWRHFSLKGSRPYSRMAWEPWMPSSFSTARSTGSPWVSQPAFLRTRWPDMVLNRHMTSLHRRAITWCTPGMPLAVGGPS